MDIPYADTYGRLAFTVLLLAARDILSRNGHAAYARWFLESDRADFWAEAAGVRADILRRRLELTEEESDYEWQ